MFFYSVNMAPKKKVYYVYGVGDFPAQAYPKQKIPKDS